MLFTRLLRTVDCQTLSESIVGHDLGGPLPWHICVRTDRHGQNIYGASLATIETTVHHSKRRPLHTVALALPKLCMSFSHCTTLPRTVLLGGWPFAEATARGLPAQSWWKKADCTGHVRKVSYCPFLSAAAPPQLDHVPQSVDWFAHWSWQDQIPLYSTARSSSPRCVCAWLLSWFLQWYLSASPALEASLCWGSRQAGRHCLSAGTLEHNSSRQRPRITAIPLWKGPPLLLATDFWLHQSSLLLVYHSHQWLGGSAWSFWEEWTLLWTLDWASHASRMVYTVAIPANVPSSGWS